MSQKKRLFVQKNPQSGDRSSLRVFIWAGVALILLLVVTPLVLRQKDDRNGLRPPTEKAKVVKNIPKAFAPPTGGSAQPPGAADEYPRGPASVPGALPDTGSSSGSAVVPEPGTVVPKVADGSEAQPAKPMTPEPSEPAPPEPAPSVVPRQPVEPAPVAGGVREREPASQPKPGPAAMPGGDSGQRTASIAPDARELKKLPPGVAPPLTPDASGARKPSPVRKGKYAVQVGAFKEKKNADEMQRQLQKKGYQAEIKISSNRDLGQLYVVVLKPVESLSRANTLMEQIKHEEKVKPMLIESR